MKQTTKKKDAFEGLDDVLGAGMSDLMREGDQYADIPLDQIEVKKQVREEFEDDQNSMEEMRDSILRLGVFQPVLVRPNLDGARPYVLVAGERRYRGSTMAGKTTIPALIREMTDEDAADMQFAENVQRKNLTQIEEAKRVQSDLDAVGGDVAAVLAKHNKGRAWLSKILALLTLPSETKRLVNENISADLEVINSVKTIEKKNPAAAKKVVDDLKAGAGKVNARDTVDAVKKTVKPPKEPKAGIVATPKDRTHEQPSDAKVIESEYPYVSPVAELRQIYGQLTVGDIRPREALKFFDKAQIEKITAYLNASFDAGAQAMDLGVAVLQGFRSGVFSTEDAGAIALVAFCHGADEQLSHFNLENILGCVKTAYLATLED